MIDLEERFDSVEEMQAFMRAITGVIPQGIYDDVETLQQQMAEASEKLANLEDSVENIKLQLDGIEPKVLTENVDLNTLTRGLYIIPNAAVARTLLNKPAQVTTETGYINVVDAGIAGQILQYYVPCVKEGGKYFVRAYYSGSWGDWQLIDHTDTGWFDLPLTNVATAFSEEQKPRYRRIGKTVFIAGVVKGVTSNDVVIATLPEGFRPSKRTIFANASSDGSTSSFTLYPNGNIGLNRNSSANPITAGQWHSVACSFCI